VSLPPQINKHQGWFWYRVNNAHTKAQSAYEGALEIYRTLAKRFWLRFYRFPRLLHKRFVLFYVRYCHCKADHEEALEIYRTLAKTNPDAYLSEMAMTLNSLGIVR
jgi:tetratricopeptide (TPR) repeat protein